MFTGKLSQGEFPVGQEEGVLVKGVSAVLQIGLQVLGPFLLGLECLGVIPLTLPRTKGDAAGGSTNEGCGGHGGLAL